MEPWPSNLRITVFFLLATKEINDGENHFKKQCQSSTHFPAQDMLHPNVLRLWDTSKYFPLNKKFELGDVYLLLTLQLNQRMLL